MKCRNCGSEIMDGKKFCGKCGSPVLHRCPECGKELSAEEKFCPECGAGLVGNKTEKPVKASYSPPNGQPVKKGKAGKWIVLAAVLLLVAGAGGFCFFRFALPLINKTAVETESKSDQESSDRDSEDKKNRKKREETEEETEETDEPEQKTSEAEAETTASSFIWGGNRQDETTAAWSSEIETTAAETTAAWDGLTDTQETGYVLPDSNSRYLQESDLDGMSPDQLRVARNEIYARHGRMFDSQDLQAYFNRQPWYMGNVAPKDFDESVLNSYEKANLEVIKAVEAKLN